MESQINSIIRSQTIQEFEFPHSNNMKTALILAGAIALMLISMESPAFGSPAPPNEASASLTSDTLIDNEGLVRQKRGTGGYGSRCTYDSDCRWDLYCWDTVMCDRCSNAPTIDRCKNY